MKKSERQENEIMEYLRVSGKMSLADAARLLNVSESTVRRLFIRLEEQGLALRSYGGIQIAKKKSEMDYSFEQLKEHHVEEKRRIAEQAACTVEDGDILYMDSGTTVSHVCIALTKRFLEGSLTKIDVFTNSLINLNILHPVSRINLIGGEYRPNRKDFCGYLAEESVKNLYFTKCFLGADGCSTQNGFTAMDFSSARLNEEVLCRTQKCIILMDAEKFSTSAVVSYTKRRFPDCVMTDKAPPAEIAAYLQEQNVSVLIAASESRSTNIKKP